MKRLNCALLFLALALGALPAAAAAAVDRDYGVEILVDGRPLAEHLVRGTTYVEALAEREYAVRLTNRTGGRVAVALAVDGLNSIDARTTSAADARKWILDPHASITIEGWQTDSSTARRFVFTTERGSYGEWLGRTENLGVISAAFFRERTLRPPWIQMRRDVDRRESDAPSAPYGKSRASAAESDALSDEHAATGIGREVDHRVRQVRFDAEARPAAVLDVRYEYRDALVRLGVLPGFDEPLTRRERSRGFDEGGFAPDPYR